VKLIVGFSTRSSSIRIPLANNRTVNERIANNISHHLATSPSAARLWHRCIKRTCAQLRLAGVWWTKVVDEWFLKFEAGFWIIVREE